jgi:hypothetical protein
MDQSHIGYTSWADPPTNNMNAIRLTEIDAAAGAKLGVAVQGSVQAWPGPATQARLPMFDGLNQQRQYIDVFNRGRDGFEFSATLSAPWIVLSTSRGRIDKDMRLWVTVDWARAPRGAASGEVRIAGAGNEVVIRVDTMNPEQVTRASLMGFAEGQGIVAIEPEHFTRKTDSGARKWIRVEGYGRTLSGMRAEGPVDSIAAVPRQDSPSLEYQMYLFTPGRLTTSLVLSAHVELRCRAWACALPFPSMTKHHRSWISSQRITAHRTAIGIGKNPSATTRERSRPRIR